MNFETKLHSYITNKMFTECLKSITPVDRSMDKNEEDSISNCYVKFIEAFKIVRDTRNEENSNQ